jgi:predicted adenine nucleotide alpha hydrolase (AANH) superfamily ATPase
MKLVNVQTIKNELERLIHNYRFYWNTETKYRYEAYKELSEWLDGLDVKEVDLEQEIQQHINDCLDIKFPTIDIKMIAKDVEYTARKFYELGLKKGE